MASMGYASLDLNTTTMFVVSAVMFLTCAFSGLHLLGARATAALVVLSLVIGWFAEYTGEKYGWFFGHYVYTDALGLKIFSVPLVIPIMWFNLCYVAMVMSFLIVERLPFRGFQSVPEAAGIAFLSAVLVTAYDLAADPYMVYVVKAWIMEKKDGWWFGETLQGFAGWMVVAFSILFAFLLAAKKKDWSVPQDFGALHALIPVSMYFSCMCFWVLYGHPVETRTISAFAMGLPILVILLSVKHWKNFKH
jgi:uncharacterized membrane protein